MTLYLVWREKKPGIPPDLNSIWLSEAHATARLKALRLSSHSSVTTYHITKETTED